ncbi:MAG: hypothetical protein II453_08070 [Alphaproteobacteria bacterium]|nr:hypothetical protein [Alphaproteobacteria bacterium]
MDKQEYTSKIMEIKKLTHETDDGKIADLLSELSDGYGELSANFDDISLKNEKLSHDNESLRDTNMRLFLRVGQVNNGGDNHVDEEQSPKRKFEDLFNEKGELK